MTGEELDLPDIRVVQTRKNRGSYLPFFPCLPGDCARADAAALFSSSVASGSRRTFEALLATFLEVVFL